MKYKLETIRVWQAYEAEAECPLCFLEEREEASAVEFFLGPSIMAPEARVELNAHGFCPPHLHMLEAGSNKLGLSLALKTHLGSIAERLAKLNRAVTGAVRSAVKGVDAYVRELRAMESDCLFCDRVRSAMNNYCYTIAKSHGEDSRFRDAFAASQGVCLHHLSTLMEVSVDVLRKDALSDWHVALAEVQQRWFALADEHLEQFTWQYDAGTGRSTPKEAQGIVGRAVRKIAGFARRA